jgi:hypothetical protein
MSPESHDQAALERTEVLDPVCGMTISPEDLMYTWTSEASSFVRPRREPRCRKHFCAAVLHWIDTIAAPVHPEIVKLLLRRTTALVVALALAAAGWAECAGWQASPEARMACCTGTGDCPMHGSTDPGAGSERVVTQAQADSCCAASDTDNSTPSSGAFSLSLSAALVTSALSTMAPPAAPAASVDAWRTHVPLTVSQVAKHVLLSVFLI